MTSISPQTTADLPDSPASDIGASGTEQVIVLPDSRVDSQPAALSNVRRHRSELTMAMASLRAAMSQSTDDAGEWSRCVRPEIDWVRGAFQRHVGVHEGGPDALHSEILRGQPHLAPLVTRLQREHRRLEAALASLSDAAYAADTVDAALIRDVKKLADDILSQLNRHRRRGADLIWEAFNHDLGGEN